MNRLPSRPLLASALLLLAAACAVVPAEPDRQARAPELPGFGELQWPITTSVPAAQRWFTQGVLQAYAFNEHEAVRMFKAALAQDPRCALCAWGVAWQLGPNINNTRRDGAPEALRYVELALRNAATATSATPRERALIDALALRYGHRSQAQQARDMAPLLSARCGPGLVDTPPDPLDLAYAERMQALAQAEPGDADLQSLWAEAEMVATRGDWWPDSGVPAGRIGAVATRLEAALALHPTHVGLNHYLIHATDARGVALRAVPAADRLGALAPASPHLVHMPSHTYVHVGRYADATRVNQAAVAADEKLFELQKQQGFSISKDWRNHDQSFLWFAALMQGRGEVALQAAREVATRATKANHWWGDYQRSLPVLALLRLQRWQDVLAEPVPSPTHGLGQALAESARGVAFMRTGRAAEARAALVLADAGASTVAKTLPGPSGWERMARDMATSATQGLRAEIALADGRIDEALQHQAQAVAAAKTADDNEPPMLAGAARSVLGDMQLRAGRAALAESTFRDDLAQQPANGWALNGLVQALRAQGKVAQADVLRPQLALAWADADASLKDAGVKGADSKATR